MPEYEKGHKPLINKQCRRGAYIVAYKGRRRDAKRHIYNRYDAENDAKNICAKLRATHPKWTVHVYNYCWEVLF